MRLSVCLFVCGMYVEFDLVATARLCRCGVVVTLYVPVALMHKSKTRMTQPHVPHCNERRKDDTSTCVESQVRKMMIGLQTVMSDRVVATRLDVVLDGGRETRSSDATARVCQIS